MDEANGPTGAMLSVQNLVKRFGSSTVLDGVSLHLQAGQVLGLLGRSGCGKSTLARCIAGIDRADSGALLLQGEDKPLPSVRTRAQRRRIQYVWQEPQRALSPYRSALQAVAESIEGFALAPPQLHAAQAAQWLARMQIDPAAMQRRPDALSGGQCQRVVLARALAAQPDVLLLDEPFSAMDTVATAGLLQLLTDTFAQRRPAVLLVSHDRVVLRRLAPRSLLLYAGRLSESAT